MNMNKEITKRSIAFLALGAIALSLAVDLSAQYADGQAFKPMKRGNIVPSFVHVETGVKQQFHIVMEAPRLLPAYNPRTEDVVWSVNGIEGGNAEVGTIDADGLYTAPRRVPGTHLIHITGFVEMADNPHMTATVLLDGIRPGFSTVYEFGEPKNALQHLRGPKAISVEQNGNFLMAVGNSILRFSEKGDFMESMGRSAFDREGHLADPRNVLADESGKFFVSDQKESVPRIMAFSNDGEYLYSFGMKGYFPGMSFTTRGMAVNSDDRLYLGDVELSRITVYDRSGEYLFHFGEEGAGTGELNGFTDFSIDKNNDIFVASYFGPCHKFDAYGRYLFSFAYPDPPSGITHITDIAADSRGNVYVAVRGKRNRDDSYDAVKDADGNRVDIIKYNNHGDFIANIQLSRQPGYPIRMTVDHDDRLVVLFDSDDMTGVEIITH